MIATVVLAAGRSERFGSPKLLAEWWGRPLVERALEIAPPGLKVAVISTPTAKLLPLFQAHGFQCIRNPKPAQGQSSSLRLALDVMPAEVEAVLVLLGDAPAVLREMPTTRCGRPVGVYIRATATPWPLHTVLSAP